MVSILPSERSGFDVIGKLIGQNVSNVLPSAIQQGINRGQLKESLGKVRNVAKEGGSSLDTILSFLEAGAGIQGFERYAGSVLPEILKYAQAAKEQNVSAPGERRGIREPIEPVPDLGLNAQTPFQKPSEQQFFPTNKPLPQAPGNLLQTATTGEIQPLLSPPQKIARAKELQKELTDAGIPVTLKEAMERVEESERDKKDYNEEVRAEKKGKIEAEKNYGKRGVDYLHRYFDKEGIRAATPEMDAIFQQFGEEAAASGESESTINHSLAKKAEQFTNAYVNAEKALSAPRLHNAITRSLDGDYKTFEQAGADVRQHLQPLLDLGLYDTARKLLDQQGYGLEEREMILHPLGESSKALLNRIPKHRPFTIGAPVIGGIATTPVSLEPIKEGLRGLQAEDSNFSLPLARKNFEDKGYDWRSFKDALNELQKEGFKLSGDQQTQLGYLDTPPLYLIGKILHPLNLTGK